MSSKKAPCFSDMQTARELVYDKWKLTQDRFIDTSSFSWHACNARQCTMLHLCDQVDVSGSLVAVTDLFVCQRTGAKHVCSSEKCTIENGRCVLTGRMLAGTSCVHNTVHSSRRTRRRAGSDITHHTAACALIYDLLYSKRRVAVDVSRLDTCVEMSRRHSQKIYRTCLKEKRPLYVQDIVDVYTSRCDRVRPMCHLHGTMKSHMQVCVRFSNILNECGMSSRHIPGTTEFKAMCASVLYLMRRGMAYSEHL